MAGVLPDSQSGYRAGGGTMDIVCCLKLAMDVAAYKQHPFHLLFADLVKAYYPVSKAGLWKVLAKKMYRHNSLS